MCWRQTRRPYRSKWAGKREDCINLEHPRFFSETSHDFPDLRIDASHRRTRDAAHPPVDRAGVGTGKDDAWRHRTVWVLRSAQYLPRG